MEVEFVPVRLQWQITNSFRVLTVLIAVVLTVIILINLD